MTHYAFQKGKELVVDVDYVVVGSGAGGAAAAVQLARSGASVAIVEAGAWRDGKDFPSSMYGAMRDWFFEWGSLVTRGRALWPIVQAQAVGGSTVINSAICVNTPEDVFDLWETQFGIPKAQFSKALWGYQDILAKELSAEVAPHATVGLNSILAKRGADAVGYDSHYMTRYVKSCAGCGTCIQGCKEDRKQGMHLNFVPEVVRRGGVVLSCAPVDRVTMDWRRATGVTGTFKEPVTGRKGANFRVNAKKSVFIAASCTFTAPLLERSGIRHNALGKFFRSHPGCGILGIYNDPVDMTIGATQGWASMAFRESGFMKLETLALPLDLMGGRLAGGGVGLMRNLEDFRNISMTVVALRAETIGTVKNGFGNRPSVSYTVTERDMMRMRAGLVTVAKTHFAAGAKQIMSGIAGLPDRLGPDDLHILENAPLDPRCYTSILSHLFGGAIMGRDSAHTVCDLEGRVHGIDGLRVVDASVLPTTLGVNPQQTIMSMAQYIADLALDQRT